MENINLSSLFVFIFGAIGFGWGAVLVIKSFTISNLAIRKKGLTTILITFILLSMRATGEYFNLF